MPEIALLDVADEAARAVATAGLAAFNAASLSIPAAGAPINLVLRDAAQGPPLGALIGRTYAGWLYVELLFVPEGLRGAGWGGRMLDAAEAEARARGLAGVRLDTYSAEARAFYEARGYLVYGLLPGCPPGGERACLAKRLDEGDA